MICSFPLCANQVQMSLAHTPMLDAGFCANLFWDRAINRDGGILEYCRIQDMIVQTWSPLQYGFFEGCFVDNDKFPRLNDVLARLADKYGVSKTTIAIAWILRHPAKMQPITGTTNLTRLVDCLQAAQITLTREEWYEIYQTAGNILP